MSNQNNGGPAFPSGMVKKSKPRHDPGADFIVTDIVTPTNCGMTLRDYFAAKAMQGLCANPDCSGGFEFYAEYAYKYAEAMLAEREK